MHDIVISTFHLSHLASVGALAMCIETGALGANITHGLAELDGHLSSRQIEVHDFSGLADIYHDAAFGERERILSMLARVIRGHDTEFSRILPDMQMRRLLFAPPAEAQRRISRTLRKTDDSFQQLDAGVSAAAGHVSGGPTIPLAGELVAAGAIRMAAANNGEGIPLPFHDRPISALSPLFAPLGNEIARLRVAHEMTQKALALELGIGFTGLAHIEAGRNPGWKHYSAIERILGLGEGYFRTFLREQGLPGAKAEYNAIRMTSSGQYAAFGSELRALRVARNMTQEALANAAGIFKQSLQPMENGSSISWKSLEGLEKALGLDQGYFLRRLGELGLPDSRMKTAMAAAGSRKKSKRIKRRWEALGMEIQRLRRERNVRCKDVAAAVDTSRQYLSLIEGGWKAGFTYHAALEKYFGLEEGYFAAKLEEWGLSRPRKVKRVAHNS